MSHSECFDAIIKTLELSRNRTLIDKMEGMEKQIELHEDLVMRLKVLLKFYLLSNAPLHNSSETGQSN